MLHKGTLYWITGLAGAGKTTIGIQLYYALKEKGKNVVILDGDILKTIMGEVVGYGYEERLKRARQYCNLCKLLTNQGIDVVICTIAMFDEIRAWNRKNIANYLEVFLDVDYDVLKERNKKGLYFDNNHNVVGKDVKAEFPKNPDIVIKNNGDITIKTCVKMILETKLKPQFLYSDNTLYWNEYYKVIEHRKNEPSQFANTILTEYIDDTNKSLIDLGCGNGRDSLFFAEQGLRVIGIDASDVAITFLKERNLLDNVYFICDDFVNSSILYQNEVDYVYSRFTMHAITYESQKKVLKNVYKALKVGGNFFVEARTVNDTIYGKGEKVEKNAFIFDGHYRRFIDMNEFIDECKAVGFSIVYAEESDNFAPLNMQKPVCMRVVAVKSASNLEL